MWGKGKKEDKNIQFFIVRINQYVQKMENCVLDWQNAEFLARDTNAIELADSYRMAINEANSYIEILRKNIVFLENIMPPRNKKERAHLTDRISDTLESMDKILSKAGTLPDYAMKSVKPYMNTLNSLIDQMTCT